MQTNDIIEFQISRHIKGLGKLSLSLLEDAYKEIESLKNELHIADSTFNYQKTRKIILDKVNDSDRELSSFIKSFKINLKKD